MLIHTYLVPIQKWLFSPISLLGENFNPRNINPMSAVKIFARLELDENISFLDGHSQKLHRDIEPNFSFQAARLRA